MKKLLSIFFIFTITTMPALAATQDCITSQSVDASLAFQFDKLPDSCKTSLMAKYNKPYTTAQNYTCNYVSYTCNVGDLPNSCAPCAMDLLINPELDKFTNAYGQIACAAKNNDTTQLMLHTTDAEKTQWIDQACKQIFPNGTAPTTVSSTSSDTAPRVESQNSTSSTETMTVSGTVLDTDNEPLIGATISYDQSGTPVGTTTDINGRFELKNVPSNAELEVSYVGHYDKKIKPGENQKIVMMPNAKIIDDVVIVGCPSDKENGIKSKTMIDGKCYPSACVEQHWKLSGTGKNAKCVEQKCNIKHGTGEWTADGDTWKCTVKSCNKNYKENSDKTACDEMLKECTDDQKKQHPNATKTGIKKGTETCIAQECKCGFKLENDTCVQWAENEQCTTDTKPALPGNAKSAVMKCDGERAYCEISDCNDGYKVSDDKKSCPSTRGDDCDATTIDKNATAGTTKKVDGKMTCVITDCASGFKPNKDGTKCIAGELSEEDSQAKIDELRDNAQKMKDKEQSTANKLLGAAGIGATGIGGMQMASAMAEENADADAERAMRAYLTTFHCNYGGGKNIAGGETNVELPGGNELINLYSEYVNLANDLKVRKTALDMRPGIESESILDAATSGLYDDVAIGKTSGAYTSLARALMAPPGADAAAWAAQKEETASKKKTGMITAGVGAAGSLVGNLALNSGKNKQNKVNEILNKYDKKKQLLDELESDVVAIPPQTATCPNGTTGTAHPDCTCTDTTKIYNPNTHACEACVGGQTAKDGKCECPTDKPLWDNENSTCIARPASCTPECTPTQGDHMTVSQNCTCSCTDGYTLTDGKCTCNGGNKRIGADGKCQTIETKTIVQQISTLTTTTVENATLPAGSLFKIGSYELVDEAKQALNKFITGLSDANYQDCEITVNGYTDPTGGANTNKTLSKNRANAVKKYIESLQNNAIKSVVANGYGESNCTCGAGKIDGQTLNYSDREYSACSGKDDMHTLSGDARYAPCRRVEITANCKHITTATRTE